MARTSEPAHEDTARVTSPPSLGMRTVVDAIPDVVLVIDTSGVIRFANRAAEVQLGYRVADFIGRSLLDLLHPDDVAGVLSSIESVQGKEEVGTPVEVRVLDSSGSWHWYEEIGTNVVLDDGSAAILCVARNITQRRMWEVASNDLARFQQVVQVAPAITLLLDGQGVVTSVNAAFTRMLGHDQSKVVGCPLTSFIAPGHDEQAQIALTQLIAGRPHATFEARMTVVGQAQHTRPVRFEMANHLADPVIDGIVVSGYDVTELEAARDELEYLARHDALTGLSTRAHLVKHLEQLLRTETPFAVLFVDLDRFKPVNDLWGHDTGDAILRLVGRRLEQTVRPLDLVARFGGDEFVVVAHDVDNLDTAQDFADRIEVVISAPYEAGTGPINIGASIGVAVCGQSSTIASLLADADESMYNSKSRRQATSMRSLVDQDRAALVCRQHRDK